jgi:hypothetical protein
MKKKKKFTFMDGRKMAKKKNPTLTPTKFT